MQTRKVKVKDESESEGKKEKMQKRKGELEKIIESEEMPSAPISTFNSIRRQGWKILNFYCAAFRW